MAFTICVEYFGKVKDNKFSNDIYFCSIKT